MLTFELQNYHYVHITDFFFVSTKQRRFRRHIKRGNSGKNRNFETKSITSSILLFQSSLEFLHHVFEIFLLMIIFSLRFKSINLVGVALFKPLDCKLFHKTPYTTPLFRSIYFILFYPPVSFTNPWSSSTLPFFFVYVNSSTFINPSVCHFAIRRNGNFFYAKVLVVSISSSFI